MDEDGSAVGLLMRDSGGPVPGVAVVPERPVARTIFQEPWWLAAASGGTSEQVEVRRDGGVVGTLAFVRHDRFGFVSLGMPRYTRTQGPLFRLPPAKPVQRTASVRRITRELLEGLPRHDRLLLWLDPDDDSALAFSLAGCTLHQAFTFRVARSADISAMWNNIEGHLRRQVRTARATMRIETHADFDRFVTVSRREREGGRNTHDYGAIERIFRACIARKQATVMSAVTVAGADAACVVLIWGHGTLYYWIPAVDRARGGAGANSLLLWSAIEFAVANGFAFDSDGYNSGATGKFFCGFDLPLARRTGVVHVNMLGRLYQARVDARNARAGIAPIVHQRRATGAEDA